MHRGKTSSVIKATEGKEVFELGVQQVSAVAARSSLALNCGGDILPDVGPKIVNVLTEVAQLQRKVDTIDRSFQNSPFDGTESPHWISIGQRIVPRVAVEVHLAA